MTLFQILTRKLATGKIKVTRKLLYRLHRETASKSHPKPRERKHRGFSRLFCASLVAALALPIFIVDGKAANAARPEQAASAPSGYSAAALFNQANAYARAGKTGLAVLNYERAQLLAPHDADTAANLHFVRAKAGLSDPVENWLPRGLTYAHPNTLAWVGCFGLLLASIGTLLVRLFPQRRFAIHSLTFVGALLIATAIANAIVMWPRVHEAVVINREAPALTTPVMAAEPLFKLLEGETVSVRAELQDFTLVQTSAGRSGWVARANLVRVVPQSGAERISGAQIAMELRIAALM
jgi:hypothetical protein